MPGSYSLEQNTTAALAFATGLNPVVGREDSQNLLELFGRGTTDRILCRCHTKTHLSSGNLLVPVHGYSESPSYVRQFPTVTSASIVAQDLDRPLAALSAGG